MMGIYLIGFVFMGTVGSYPAAIEDVSRIFKDWSSSNQWSGIAQKMLDDMV
jgi:hypothetical protein